MKNVRDLSSFQFIRDYREPGAKRSAVKKGTLLNLTEYPPQLVRAIELALKHKEDLSALSSLKEVKRDKKRGKKQIVIGLLCDETGEPVSIQVFEGNTGDLETFADQVRKVSERFGCHRVTFVGDQKRRLSVGFVRGASVRSDRWRRALRTAAQSGTRRGDEGNAGKQTCLGELNRICAMELSVAGMDAVLRLPEPSPVAKQLLDSLHVNLPPVLPRSKVVVDTKRKLPTRRKDV